MTNIERILGAALRKILRPLAKILLRNGIAYGSFSEIAKRVFVEVAFDEFTRPGKKQTVSRVSALTGLTRKEVSRIRDTEPADDMEASQRYNRAVRVIGGWINDPEYSSESEPLDLSINSPEPSFTSLVKRYSGDIPTQAMLDVLVTSDSVEKINKDTVRLKNPAYIPSSDPADKINILGTDVQEIISTIDHNIISAKENLRFQRKVSNPNVRPETIREFQKLSGEKAQALLEDFDDWLYKHEVDTTDNDETGAYVSLGVYFYTNDQ